MSEPLASARSFVDKPLPPILDHIPSYTDLDVIAQVREASLSPSPLAELLQDPLLIKSLTRPRRASRRPSTPSIERSRKDDRDSDTTSVLTIVLAEEERQGNHLKALLRITGERLDAELRRAEQAESRAEYSETRLRELQIRLSSTDVARHQAELEAARLKEEVKRYRMQAEISEGELQRTRDNNTTLTRQKDGAVREETKARELAREYLQKIREYEARDDGREEGRRIGIRKGYNAGWEECRPVAHAEGYNQGYEEGCADGYTEGHSEGFNAGRLAGFEEGKKKGRADGISEGIARGRKEEREHALHEFDKFLTEEMGGSEYDRNERTDRWVQSIKQNSDSTPRMRSALPRGRAEGVGVVDGRESESTASLVIP